MEWNKIDLKLEETPEGCLVVVSHKLNHDGYFRRRVGGKLQMNHRFVWEQANGPIPEGYEVDHMCRNRACQNINHLQVLDRTSHLIKTNKERYAPRHAAAKAYWQEHRCTGTKLAELFGVSFGMGCKWIRSWKQESAETIPEGSRP